MEDSIFLKRHSGRSYIDKKIPKDVIEKLSENIRWSPSCANKQPWRFIFCSEGDTRKKFNAALAKGNDWAEKAPILVALCARESDDYTRGDDPVQYYQFDSGMACLSLLLGAEELGLMGHAMAGYNAAAVKKALSIPDEYHLICVVSLGYEGTLEMLDERTRAKDEAERTRKPVNEIICFDKFSF